MKKTFQKGDIVLGELPDNAIGSEQQGIRPCVIISNHVIVDKYYVVAIITRQSEKRNTKEPYIALIKETPMDEPSEIHAEQIFVLSEDKMIKKINRLQGRDMNRLDEALHSQFFAIFSKDDYETEYNQGDIVLFNKRTHGLIISNQKGNYHAPVITFIPLAPVDSINYSDELLIVPKQITGLEYDTYAIPYALRTFDKSRFKHKGAKVGTFHPFYYGAVNSWIERTLEL
ncbi:type II toxin-antitoxin system PemK/MazF family toxin [Alkalibacillus aidingensis]|uniref:type II toxin-antitoxin system PemK/MazF family toxin n=1 Tax=Alkalibacillus aidingensis TaxID=2747607 RepID=UPI001660D7AD|nr:type II toxin-antitoxin system PemK/MazF family toxin [Alkalibacillus aidingensis]